MWLLSKNRYHMKADELNDVRLESLQHERTFDEQQHDCAWENSPGLSMRRRTFLKVMGNGLAVFFTAAHSPFVLAGTGEAEESQLDAWIHIGENDQITVFTGKVEVGQNIRTSLAQIVAEELDEAVDSIEMVMGDTALTPYDR